MTKNSKKAKRDLYQEVTNRMIELLEQGVAPWRCTWNKYGAARNYVTGHQYTGINAFLMNLTPHPIPYFMSFKQVKAKGGKIRKGAKANMVLFYKTLFKDEKEGFISLDKARTLQGMGEDIQTIPMLKYYSVFKCA